MGVGAEKLKTVNAAAGAEDRTCSVPIPSASCRNPSRGENTFKHPLFSLLSNMNWAPTFSASVVWVYFRRAFCTTLCQTQTNAMSSDPSGTLFCKHHILTVQPFSLSHHFINPASLLTGLIFQHRTALEIT